MTVRAGASTLSIGAPGKQAVGNDLRYQAVISKMARECTINAGQITAKIGIQGRVIAGPAGAPPTVTVPMRVAVIQGGVGEKVIATKAYQTTVSMTEDSSVPFVIVVDDLVYPAPPGALGDSYVFYVGFDPQALKPEPKAKPEEEVARGAVAAFSAEMAGNPMPVRALLERRRFPVAFGKLRDRAPRVEMAPLRRVDRAGDFACQPDALPFHLWIRDRHRRQQRFGVGMQRGGIKFARCARSRRCARDTSPPRAG